VSAGSSQGVSAAIIAGDVVYPKRVGAWTHGAKRGRMTEQAPKGRQQSRALQVLELGELTVCSEREGDVHTIGLAGELDLATVGAVEHELKRVETSDALSIVVDLSDLTFMDSTGIRMLINADARSRADGHRLILLPGPVSVQRVFEVCGVQRRLPFAA
jgi:anti-anti-sigma factor